MAGASGYRAIEDYGLIGDMHTCALVSKDSSLDFMCWPVFDSPSVFCRLLDKDKGGYFSVNIESQQNPISKQRYLPYTNMLETRWITEEGVCSLLDYFPVSGHKSAKPGSFLSGWCPCTDTERDAPRFLGSHSAVVRKIGCARGSMDIVAELFPAFNYARDEHTIHGPFETKSDTKSEQTQSVRFESPTETLQVDIHIHSSDGDVSGYLVPKFETQQRPGLKGPGLFAKFCIKVGQCVTFVVHSPEKSLAGNEVGSHLDELEKETYNYWANWTRKCTFRGHYREQVERSLLVLKLLTFKPTGAIVAAPTFSLPEYLGGQRNWDYRYSWIRDTAFTLYVFLKNGYEEEAESYFHFIFDKVIPRLSSEAESHRSKKQQFLTTMVTIRGEEHMTEFELDHLDGYQGSRPVRVGNQAISQKQLDLYGAFLDGLYLFNKLATPISYDQWLAVRRIVNYIIQVVDEPDMSIWEVRGQMQNFVYSKVMLWVAIDRALRLADKRSNLPCPERNEWLRVRDELYDKIMENGYNKEKGFFCMSYENRDILDASLLIAPLVFFTAPNDPRFLSTLNKIMAPPEDGGLSSANVVFRYDQKKVNDGMSSPPVRFSIGVARSNVGILLGIGGQEGCFAMVTFWLVEALARVSSPFCHGQLQPFVALGFSNLIKLDPRHLNRKPILLNIRG